MNNYYFTMATQHSQMTDRKQTRTDMLTTSLDSAPICSWPRFLLIKGTDNERPLSKLSPFAVNKATVAVSQFIPNPIRCYKCQKFGHTKFNCRKNEVCNKCGNEDHTDSQECTNEAKCVNCQGNHASNDKTCPKWKEEKEIQRIKAERGISYTDA